MQGRQQGTDARHATDALAGAPVPDATVKATKVPMDGKGSVCKDFSVPQPLPDGTYDVVVVDAEVDDDDDLHLEVAVTLGPHIGRIVRLRKLHVDDRRGVLGAGDPYALLGIPGTLRVRDGAPSFRPETV